MENDDTAELLKECNSGIQMAVYSIEEVLDKTGDVKLKGVLTESKAKHKELGDQTHRLLSEHHEETKEPNAMAKGMSWLKTNTKMVVNESDKTIADLITDGCNMGIKSLYRYLNQYKAADDTSRAMAEDIIREEETLRQNLRDYL